MTRFWSAQLKEKRRNTQRDAGLGGKEQNENMMSRWKKCRKGAIKKKSDAGQEKYIENTNTAVPHPLLAPEEH